MIKRLKRLIHNKKRGFTLVEAISAVAIFAMFGVMFATFMSTSSRLVNLSLMYDKDREKLVRAVESYNEEGTYGDITVKVTTPEGGVQELTIRLDNAAHTTVVIEGEYITYKTRAGRMYSIYIGKDEGGEGGGG